jgi:uncharacterized sporulation protein YeaH/YhbH (DUF444 family)
VLNLIDRRLNGRNKSAANRERFLRRYKDQIRKSVENMVGERSITDMDKGGNVNIPVKDIGEPQFRHGRGGDRETVHPGNREFVKGDTIKRPGSGAGGDGSDGEPGEGESVDDFVFSLSREEFLDLFFDDLELPHLLRTTIGQVVQTKWQSAGFVSEGAPCNLSVGRTLKTALGRRIALSSAIRRNLAKARARLEQAKRDALPEADIALIESEVALLEARLARLPFLDELDLRYRNRVAVPAPIARAVMFCLMDVSASMDEARKDLAKRFFTLLYMFLSRKYEKVDLVFIRHTEEAEEVDEQKFFHDTGTGGTVVLTALELAHKIATERYAGSGWNVYIAQASDGDAFGADAGKSARFVDEHLLPMARYFAYIEVRDPGYARDSSLWASYETIQRENFSKRHVAERAEIYPVFRDLFRKETA